MAEPNRPHGQRSLFAVGMRRVAEKRPPPGARADAGGRARGRGRAQQAAAQTCGEGMVVVVDP